MLISTGCAITARAENTQNLFRIDGVVLQHEFGTSCKKGKLATKSTEVEPVTDRETLIQSGPEHDDIKLAQRHLKDNGFAGPNGKDSPITLMDFDGDGLCDFAARVEVDSASSTELMMLFRGLGSQRFELMDTHFVETGKNPTHVPYIPARIINDDRQVIIVPRAGRMLRWRNDGSGFASCEVSATDGQYNRMENIDTKEFAVLCISYPKIEKWAEPSMKHEEIDPGSAIPSSLRCGDPEGTPIPSSSSRAIRPRQPRSGNR